MIEINLLPDAKRDYIRAQQGREFVKKVSRIVGAAAIGLVVLVALYTYVFQYFYGKSIDSKIGEKDRSIQGRSDLENILTIQNQLTQLPTQHEEKPITSRIFDVLAAINPAAPYNVTLTTVKVDTENGLVTIEGQAISGYQAAEAFKKTILKTNMKYKNSGGENQTVALTDDVSTAEMSYGEDATGAKVLRFTMSFAYSKELFARSSEGAVIEKPTEEIVTDSHLRLPQHLLSDGEEAVEEEEGEDAAAN